MCVILYSVVNPDFFLRFSSNIRGTLVPLSRTPLDLIPDPKESFVPTCDSDMLKIYSWVANIFGMIRNKIGVMYKIINRTNWRIYEHEHEQNPDCFIDESALN